MPSEWRTVRLGDLAEIFDGPHATPAKTEAGPLFLGISNLVAGRIDITDAEHLSEQDYRTWTRRVTPVPEDVVFSYETRIGQAAYIPSYLRCCLGRRMGLLRARRDKIDPRFLLYAYLGPQFQEVLRARTIYGSTVERIPLIDMPEFPMSIPEDMRAQRAIARILGALDDKIELNRKMNETLEQMARAVFKSWFVDFEPFRDKGMVDSPLGKIPKGWRVCGLGQCLALLKDGSHNPPKRAAEGIPFIAGATDVKHFSIDFAKCTYITKDDYSAIHRKWSVQAGDVLLTIVGTVGNVAIVAPYDLPFSLQRSLAVLRAGPELSSSFLYSLLDAAAFRTDVKSRLNPTAQPGIYLGTIAAIPICLPPRSVVETFDAVASAAFAMMQSTIKESRTLAAIRDALLPKLMSGEVRVT